MIERQFLKQKMKLYQVEEYIATNLNKAGYNHTEIKRTPLGDKVIIYTSKPGLIVGRKGENIRELTEVLKKKFQLENPQIEVAEVENPNLDAQAVAKRIIQTFERFGPKRFKSIGYRSLQDILDAGALGAEIVISGRGIPSQRAKRWRFKAGYLKKSGDIAENHIRKSTATAHLRSGAVGVKVSILTPDTVLPDKILMKQPQETQLLAKPEEKKEESSKKEEKKEPKKKTIRKKTTKHGNTEKK